eukprot:XP_001704120.1 Hypothetical protein GL50803_31031 [Giardia lamblia ATCC 50803]
MPMTIRSSRTFVRHMPQTRRTSKRRTAPLTTMKATRSHSQDKLIMTQQMHKTLQRASPRAWSMMMTRICLLRPSSVSS